MGLFDNAFDEREGEEGLSKAESFAGVLLSAAACDGHISEEEAQGLYTTAARMKLFESISPKKFSRIIDRLLGILKREGHEDLLDRSVQSLPDELRATAFANACDLVLADQGIEEEEKEFLSILQRKLHLEREESLKIFKIMVVKNRG